MDHYGVLGLARDADLATIKKAYRVKAQKAHPDRNKEPGAKEKFHAIQRAYDTLSDPERKKRYDERGEDGAAPDPRQVALSSIATLLLQLSDQVDIDHTDIRKLIIQNIQAQIAQLALKKREHGKKIGKLERLAKRVRKKTAGPNLLTQFVDAQVIQHKNAIVDIERQEKTGADILAILDEYEYDFDKDPVPGPFVRLTIGPG